jgi:GNAT superfamily N-acetyltransferase
MMRAVKVAAVQIRAAQSSDVTTLCEFVTELLQRWNAHATQDDARRVYERIVQSPELGVILVAEDKGALCGFAYASFGWRSEFGGETMDLVELFVNHAWRNQGVGQTLLNALLTLARQRNIRRVTCQVHPGNAAIERALEACGFDPERRTIWGLLL